MKRTSRRSKEAPQPLRPIVPLLALSLAACSSSSGGGGAAGVTNPVQAFVVESMGIVFAAVAQLKLLVPVLLFPPAAAAAGITFDPVVGGAPNTYDFTIPLDSNGNGSLDTTITGQAVFSADPTVITNLIAGFTASTDVHVANGTGGMFDGTLELGFNPGGRFIVSGSGTYDGAGGTISLQVDGATPVSVRTATDEPDKRPNACTWTVEGVADLQASSVDGDYEATWVFDPTSKLVQVLSAFFTPTGGTQEALPDSRFAVDTCPGIGSFQDWAGVYTFDWFCPRAETGQSTLTITVLNSSRIEILDEDPPGSGDVIVYRADRDPHDPHIVHGTFEDTDGGGTYEEDFTWILSDDSTVFHQVSEFFYLSGPLAGESGVCGGQAVRN